MATRTITHLDPMSVAKVMAVVYGLIGCLFIPFAWLGVFASGDGFPLLMAMFVPVMYAIGGFIGCLLGALLFNVAAGWVGGIQVQLDE